MSPADRMGLGYSLRQTAQLQEVATSAPAAVQEDMGRPRGEWVNPEQTAQYLAPVVAGLAIEQPAAA